MENWDMWLCIIVYSLTLIFFGGFLEYQIIKVQLPGIVQKAWTEGCKSCAQFEKNACERDQLQGVRQEPELIQ